MDKDLHTQLARVAVGGSSFYSLRARKGGVASTTHVIVFVLLLLHVFASDACAQQQMHKIDSTYLSVHAEPDLYKGIRESASKRRWTRQLYSFLFREPAQPLSLSSQGSVDIPYQKYTGRTIDNIHIVVLSPFGTNVNYSDTCTSSNWFELAGNKIHVNSQSYIIRNILLFKRGEALNPLNVAESEALLRNSGFVNDVIIRVDSIPSDADRVNVTVVLRDNWTIGANLHSLSQKSADMEIFDRNFMGTGRELSVRVLYNNTFNYRWGFGAAYFYRNIGSSFVDFRASYLNLITDKEMGWSLERNLLPTIHYFGQLSYDKRQRNIELAGWDSISPSIMSNNSVSLGRAFDVGVPKEGRRMTLAARYMTRKPSYPTVFTKDTLPYTDFENRFLLMQWSVFRQRFYRENMLNSFGVIENIAFGYNVSAQLGYSNWPRITNGWYASFSGSKGINKASGNYFLQGSVSSFFNQQGFFQGVLHVQLRYYTPLLKAGRSRFRQFVTVDYSKSLNPLPIFINHLYYSTFTHLNTSQFNAQSYGLERLMMSAESNVFTPLYVAGFRCMFYSFLDAGWLNVDKSLLHSNNFFWGAGLGLRLRNDLLVFRTLDIKFGWYPRLGQLGLGHFVNVSTSEPRVSPSFVPGYPQEIKL